MTAVARAWRVLLMGALVLAAFGARAQDPRREADQIKAAYVLNFLRFTDWPQEHRPVAADEAYMLKVVGTRSFVTALRAIAREAVELGQRPVRIERIGREALLEGTLDAELASAHAVFVQFDGSARTEQVLQRLKDYPVLTIGDAPGFAQAGGMLGLVPQGSRIVFDANPSAIQASGLQVSAKVLKLARVVEPPR